MPPGTPVLLLAGEADWRAPPEGVVEVARHIPGARLETLTGVSFLHIVTPMPMKKTQVYFRAEELKALHRIARERKRPVAELVREAVRTVWLQSPASWPIGLWTGPVPAGGSADHDSAFDER